MPITEVTSVAKCLELLQPKDQGTFLSGVKDLHESVWTFAHINDAMDGQVILAYLESEIAKKSVATGAAGGSGGGGSAPAPGGPEATGRANYNFSKTFLGKDAEGLKARPIYTGRRATSDLLVVRVVENGFVVLRGPPRSGKTSLLQLVAQRVIEAIRSPFSRVFHVSCAGVAQDASWEQLFYEQTGQQWTKVSSVSGGGAAAPLPGLLLIDELQCLYGDPARFGVLWGYLKRLGSGDSRLQLRILAAAVFGSSPSDDPHDGPEPGITIGTPFECDAMQLVGLRPASEGEPGLVLTPAEYSDLWGQLWRDCGLTESELFVGSTTKDAMFQITAGQVGLIVFITDHIRDRLKQVTTQRSFDRAKAVGQGDNIYRQVFRIGHVYAALTDTRAFLKFEALGNEQLERWELFQKLLLAADGVLEGVPMPLQGSKEHLLVTKLHRAGHLALYKTAAGHVYYAFHTPLHLLYYQHQLLHARVSCVYEAADVSTLEFFLLACIPRMLGSHGHLRDTLSVGSTGRLLERQLQVSFAMAALSVLPHKYNVCPDVGKTFDADGIVDFWITPVNWAIELLRDGSDMSEHERRFQPGGKYAGMPFELCAVLDFRSQPAAQPRARQLATSYHIVFAADYGSATLINRDRRWELESPHAMQV